LNTLYLIYITIEINKTFSLIFTIDVDSNNILIESNSNTIETSLVYLEVNLEVDLRVVIGKL